MKKVDIIGGGPTGLVLANLLSRVDHIKVNLFEKRSESELFQVSDEKSINLTISNRGLRTLQELGLSDGLARVSAPVLGRNVHLQNGKNIKQFYGNNNGQAPLYSVRRHELLELLYEPVKDQNINIRLGEEFTRLDKRKNEFHCINRETRERQIYPIDLLLGCDGTFSTVRSEMLKGEPFDYSQCFFYWSYVQFTLGSELRDLHQHLDPLYIHFWPRKNSLALLLPNSDGSFSGDLFLQRNGGLQFSDFQNRETLAPFLKDQFPDLKPYWDTLIEEIQKGREAFTVSNQLSDWVYKDKILLVGDSSHSCYYFYGQGLNISLEDSLHLYKLLANQNSTNYNGVLKSFQKHRKPNSDILLGLSEKNFFFIKDKSTKLSVNARYRCNALLNKLTKRWKLEYALITEGDYSLPNALKRIRLQRRIFWVTCFWLYVLVVFYLFLFPSRK